MFVRTMLAVLSAFVIGGCASVKMTQQLDYPPKMVYPLVFIDSHQSLVDALYEPSSLGAVAISLEFAQSPSVASDPEQILELVHVMKQLKNRGVYVYGAPFDAPLASAILGEEVAMRCGPDQIYYLVIPVTHQKKDVGTQKGCAFMGYQHTALDVRSYIVHDWSRTNAALRKSGYLIP